MRAFLLGIGLLIAVFLTPHEVKAQAIVLPCVPSGNSCIPVSAANPLPTTGGGGGGITIGTTTVTGGATTQVLFNLGGVVSSDSGFTYAGSGGQVSINGAALGATTGLLVNPASASGLLADFQVGGTSKVSISSTAQTTIALGTITTNIPGLSITGTWNAVGTTFDAPLLVNITPTAAAVGSRLFDFQQNGISSFYGDWHGSFYITGNNTNDNPNIQFFTGAGSGVKNFQISSETSTGITLFSATTRELTIGGTTATWNSALAIGWSATGDTRNAQDTGICRSGIGVIEISTTTCNAAGSLLLTNITASGAAVLLTGVASDAAATDTTLCLKSADGTVLKGSGTLGICLGTSGRQFKTDFAPMMAGLAEIRQVALWNYHYLPGWGDGGARIQFGPTAQDIETVPGLGVLVGRDTLGTPINYDIGALIPISMRAIQELATDNDNLRTRVNELERRVAR